MNDFAQNWLQEASSTPGLFLCGVRGADHSVSAVSRHETFPETHARQLMQQLAETIQLFWKNQIAADQLDWTFEYGRIYCAIRANGEIAMMLVDQKLADPVQVGKLLLDFQNADF